ncbi:50S ribosomal protein L1 [Candidatus Saganbacteria bacterium]|nr:50S ribosomal protein L1 [Candidatus Saganbacteria bacterium]
MNKTSKKYLEKTKTIDTSKKYSFADAVKLVKGTAWAKFPESVDLAITLNLPSKKPDSIRGLVTLPNGTGKTMKVAVLSRGDKLKEAEQAGADVFGADDLIERISKGFLDFDVLLATPDMMPQVGKLGKILGTKGLMPNPKSGTVTNDIAKSIKEFKAGKLEYRMEKGGVVHLLVGKISFELEKIKENLAVALNAVRKSKPSSVKGSFFKSATISSTMGPGIKLDLREMETEE